MRYADYLRVEGTGSIVLGLALALVAFPGLVVSYDHVWTAPLFVLAFALVASAWRRSPDPRRWFTDRPLTTAVDGGQVLGEPGLRRRLWIETLIWIVLVGGWVLIAKSSGLFIFGTALASVAYGLVQAGPSRSRVLTEEARTGADFRIAERPGLGTPRLRR